LPSTRPIRAPLRAYWRELRFRFVPTLMFVAVCIGAGLVWRQWIIPTGRTAKTGEGPRLTEAAPGANDRATKTLADLDDPPGPFISIPASNLPSAKY